MRKTERLNSGQLDRAAEILVQGGLVAFPTETVYGLGAHATNASSVADIFRAKGRPSDNPLIVHLADIKLAGTVCRDVPKLAVRLMTAFSPGPLTLVLPKRECVPDLVTAGLDSVAIRIPRHPIAQALLRLAGIPVAAPSANLSGRPSGTTWRSVLDDLDSRIDAIVYDDSPPGIGLESTVLDLTSEPPQLLRVGAITIDDLRQFDNTIDWQVSSRSDLVNSPGRRHPHYKPQAIVRLCNDPAEIPLQPKQAFIGLHAWQQAPKDSLIHISHDVAEYANAFFEFLRQADRSGAKVVWCQRVPLEGLGIALMDRLERAASTD
jgi:L-threonylcarbamoyladenylate synthase